jgi:hypothetical protein
MTRHPEYWNKAANSLSASQLSQSRGVSLTSSAIRPTQVKLSQITSQYSHSCSKAAANGFSCSSTYPGTPTSFILLPEWLEVRDEQGWLLCRVIPPTGLWSTMKQFYDRYLLKRRPWILRPLYFMHESTSLSDLDPESHERQGIAVAAETNQWRVNPAEQVGKDKETVR